MDESRHECFVCGKQFAKSSNLHRHERNKHGPEYDTKSPKVHSVCPLCHEHLPSRQQFVNHLKDVHNIELTIVRKGFTSIDEFQEWKSDIERSTTSCYICNGRKKEADSVTEYFICHRSRTFNENNSHQNDGIKTRKRKKGSRKMDATCPSRMSVQVTDGAVYVEFTNCHLGHGQEVEHVPLSKRTKDYVASLLAMGLPKAQIVARVHETSNHDRDKLLTYEDVNNIEKKLKKTCPDLLTAIEEGPKVSLICSDGSVSVSKMLLDMRCPTLKTMIVHENQEQKIDIKDFDSKTIASFVRFMTPDEVINDDALGLYTFGHKYKVPVLKDRAKDHILNHINDFDGDQVFQTMLKMDEDFVKNTFLSTFMKTEDILEAVVSPTS